MKRQIWILAVPLVLTLTSTGCNMLPGADAEAEHAESVQPLDPAVWPTPQPSAPQASPTPFPKITLAPTVTPTPHPAVSGETSASGPTAPSGEGFTLTGDIGDLVEQVTELSGGFPPTAAAMVTADSVTVRQGPADSHASVGTAQGGELAAVLGTNTDGNWWYVLTRSGLQGWLPTEALQITFSLAEAPVLPDDPVAQKPASTSTTINLLTELEPVAVALVTADNGTTIRQGPASSYPVSGTAEQSELAGVFGINAAGDWLYVFTISGANGWLPAGSVRVTGSLAGAPVLTADPLAASAPQAGTPHSSEPGPSTASAVGIQPLDLDQLDPVTTARVDNDALNVRQGPGAAYELLGTLSRDDEVTVLALNKTREWALVKTADGGYGWASMDYLLGEGSLADAPQVISPAPNRSLPTGQVAPIFSPSGVESNANVTTGNTGNTTQSGANPAPVEQVSTSSTAAPVLTWTPVATARANQPDAKLYRGPATTFEPIVSLAKDETISVLGLNQGQDWALVKPADDYKSPGWVPLKDLSLDGSLANAPQVITAWVDSNELAVLRGPGLFYEQTGQVAINTLVAVLGVNEGRNWALIQPVMSGGQGWISVNFLTLTGSWSDVPVAPAPPLVPAEASASQGAPASLKTGTAGPGRLVFQTSSGGDIMVINLDGSGLRRLTQGIDPVLSPDGGTVAFTRWTGEDGALWLIDLDGSNERPLLGGTKQAKHPAWSPDGQRIVVNFQQGGRLDPKQACQNLIELGDGQPDIPWNVDPDSIEVKFDDYIPYLCWTLPPDPHWGLRVVDVASGRFEDVPSDTYAFGPEWDPANSWRVVSSGLNGLAQLDVNRSEQWALSDRREDHTPAFSPDGRFIAVAFNNNGHYDIHRLNSDGSGRVALTKTPLWVTAEPGQKKPWNNVSPAWSPDGSQIAFLTDRTGRWEIWVMPALGPAQGGAPGTQARVNADGSNQRPMFSDEVNDQLQITYDFVDERMLSWR